VVWRNLGATTLSALHDSQGRLKVAIVTAFPEDPAAPQGGVEGVSVNLVRALSRFEDLDIHVVTIDPGRTRPSSSTWEGVGVHRLPQMQRHTLLNTIGAGRRQMRDYLASLAPDLVHSHDNYGLMVKHLTIPRVFTVHGFIHVDTALEGGLLSGLRARVWRWLETSGWAEQPHIISITPYVRQCLRDIARGTIHDIDNPVGESFFHVKGVDRGRIVFSAACISRLKNTLGLLKGFARLCTNGCEARLRLAGTCHEADYDRCLKGFIRDHDLTSRVVFLGSLPAEQIQAELASASLFALVSLHENAPLSIEEAMAAGVPIITSNRCGMPYMVRDGESGFLVEPNDPEDIAHRLGQLLMNDELRRSMGVKGREIALDRFHPAKVAARTREVYLRIIADSRRK
jgi:glycosyltransferase involved in cell wall biosynthesis